MKKVFMVHGFQGEPNGGWRPWLMGELAQNDIWACALPMPSPDHPVKEDWINKIKNSIVNENKEDIFLIGHSLGSPAILRYLEQLEDGEKIGGVVLVSGPIAPVLKEGYEEVNKFLENDFNFDKIKQSSLNFSVIHGDNDQNVPLEEAVQLSSKLSCNLIVVKNGGHLNGSSGCFKLPEALNELLRMIK